jgi:prophage maintenance system killer protein
MNKRTANLASRLYLLANTAHQDCLGADNDEQVEVMQAAIDMARSRLEFLGFGWSALSSLQACIDAAKARSKQGEHP